MSRLRLNLILIVACCLAWHGTTPSAADAAEETTHRRSAERHHLRHEDGQSTGLQPGFFIMCVLISPRELLAPPLSASPAPGAPPLIRLRCKEMQGVESERALVADEVRGLDVHVSNNADACRLCLNAGR